MDKTCTKCYITKDISQFNKDSKSKDGHTTWCKDCVCENAHRLRNRYPRKHRKRKRDYQVNNKLKVRQYFRIYMKHRRENDVEFKIKCLLRTRLKNAIKSKGARKYYSAQELLGCNIEFFKGYITAKFRKGMNWKNHGEKWHIDHIVPCSKFDLTREEQQKMCFHYTNLQPLFVKENHKKYNKETEPVQFTFI